MPKGIQQKISYEDGPDEVVGHMRRWGLGRFGCERLPPQALQNFAPSSLLPPQVGQYIVLDFPFTVMPVNSAMYHRISPTA